MRHSLLMLVAALVLFTVAWMGIAPEVGFTSDVGLRLIQVQALIDQGWRSFAIPYPDHLDAGTAHVPYYYAYSLIDGEIFLNISPFFPLLGSLLYAGLGTFGLVILPAASGLAAAWLTYRLARLSAIPHTGLVFFSALFATPLFVYSVVFWDHIFATALATAAVYFVARGLVTDTGRLLAVGGWFMGLTLGQRPEAYTFAIALGLALLLLGPTVWRSIPVVVGGALGGVLPLWWLQYLWVGHPLGLATAPHLLGYGRPEQYAFLAGPGGTTPLQQKILLLSYIQPDEVASIAKLALLVVGAILLILSVRVERFRHPLLLYAGTCLMGIGYLLAIFLTVTGGEPLPGIVTTFPLVGFSLAYVTRKTAPDRDGHLVYRMVTGTALFFIALMVAFWPADGGRQWGSRYLLLVYPLLVYLAFYAYASYEQRLVGRMRQALQLSLAGLLLVSLLLHGTGLREQFRLNQEVVEQQREIARVDSEIVITNHPWLPALMGSALDKTFFYAHDIEKLSMLLARLVEDGVRDVAIIPGPFWALHIPDRVGNYRVVNVAPNEFELQTIE